MTVPGGHADASYLLDSAGPAAPPRDNGELVFAAPWESRAFGVALALHDAGRIDWEDFRQSLIREIGEWEAAHPSGAGWSYYDCWQRALERVACGSGLVTADDLQSRRDLLAARPPGHDHRHPDLDSDSGSGSGSGEHHHDDPDPDHHRHDPDHHRHHPNPDHHRHDHA